MDGKSQGTYREGNKSVKHLDNSPTSGWKIFMKANCKKKKENSMLEPCPEQTLTGSGGKLEGSI